MHERKGTEGNLDSLTSQTGLVLAVNATDEGPHIAGFNWLRELLKVPMVRQKGPTKYTATLGPTNSEASSGIKTVMCGKKRS